MTQKHPLRFGILGAAQIARKNWAAIYHSGNCQIVAVASRDGSRARQMIQDCQPTHPFPIPPRVTEHYESLLEDPAVDAVYAPLPTAVRKQWVIRAAKAGKHVLCEKPCAVSHADLTEMVQVCRRHNVQFMDGVMFMHNPRMARLRDILNDDTRIGPLRRITTVFSFLGGDNFQSSNIRTDAALEPFGCLGDLGWYCIRFALCVMDWQLPHSVSGRILADAGEAAGQQVPVDFSGELQFEGAVSAGFHCSFRAENQQWANVSGSRGWLRVPDFVLPTSDAQIAWEVNDQPVMKCDAGIELGTVTCRDSQESLMFRQFANQVRSGMLNEDWPHVSLLTQQVLDACLTSARANGTLVALA